jgi:uncharacterized protein YraI
LTLVIGCALLFMIPTSDARERTPRQASDVYAEAIGQANLRSGPGLDYPIVGQISIGTRYRVLAQHSQVPWLRLDYPVPGEAWVFMELVTVTGSLVPIPVVEVLPPVVTLTPTQPGTAAPTGEAPTVTPTLAGPFATTQGDANIRYGPGVEYPSIVEVPTGSSFQVVRLHNLVPWIEIALPQSPTGTGWIYRDLVTITGNIAGLPTTSATTFDIPQLTPTPQMLVVSGAPWQGAPHANGTLASTLGQLMYNYLLEQNYIPYSPQFASVFVMDLQTGDHFTLNGGIAYSGMSLTKIPILVSYFVRHEGPLSDDEAFLIADTMMCSENITTNQLLGQIGEGDTLRGAQRVTATMQRLNLRGTFIMREYLLQEGERPPNVGTITTGYDQDSARPDAYNQAMPEDLGWLLAGIYQCAQDGTGLLMNTFPNELNVQECRQMLRAMDSNQIGVFIEAGVPDTTTVIHKHGWIGDTHGDAGLVIGPNGAYVIVMTLFHRDWLEFEYSAPIIGELSRMAWNYFYPTTPVLETQSATVPEGCDPRSAPVMDELLSYQLPAPGPIATATPAVSRTPTPTLSPG